MTEQADAASLDALLGAATAVLPGHGDWFSALAPDIQAVISKHLARPVSDAALSKQFKLGGYEVSAGQIGHHRRGQCACQRPS